MAVKPITELSNSTLRKLAGKLPTKNQPFFSALTAVRLSLRHWQAIQELARRGQSLGSGYMAKGCACCSRWLLRARPDFCPLSGEKHCLGGRCCKEWRNAQDAVTSYDKNITAQRRAEAITPLIDRLARAEERLSGGER